MRDKRTTEEQLKKFITDFEACIKRRIEDIKTKENIKDIYFMHDGNQKELLETTIAAYSVGEPIEQVRARFIRLVDYLPVMHKLRAQMPEYVKQGYFAYNDQILLLSMAVLLDLDMEHRQIIVDDVSFFEDEEWDSILQVMCNYLLDKPDFAKVAPRIEWKDMTPLWRAIEDPSFAGAMYLEQYIKRWYQGHKGTYWYNYHKEVPNLYFGYWNFEAAAVSVMMDIPDNDFRQNQYYPAELADWARAHKKK